MTIQPRLKLATLRAIITDPRAVDRANPDRGTFHEVHHTGERNVCPGCGGTHWHVGRTMAECAKCETALPLMAALPTMERRAAA